MLHPLNVEGTCCKMPMVQKNCPVEHEVDVVDHCCQSVALISNKIVVQISDRVVFEVGREPVPVVG